MEPIDIINAISGPENLKWAWQKVRKFYSTEAAWKDESEIAGFELDLSNELKKIAESFRGCHYKLSPIRPVPQPKHKDEAGDVRLRQLFWIPVADQVAWMAVVNVIGPLLDSKMPIWSFGNRLHRTVWFEEQLDGKNLLKIGPYRQTTGKLYRRFSQSWPLYRRYIYLTVRHLANKQNKDFYFELEEAEKQILQIEERSPETHKMPYLIPDYWESSVNNKIYWASLDFKKFYPNLSLDIIREVVLKELSIPASDPLNQLLKTMMVFPVDYSGLLVDLAKIDLLDKPELYTAIPTGLMVGGFLANVAMLDIDKAVSIESKKYQVAHFRYVDDHIILSRSFDDLTAWIKRYQLILDGSGVAEINLEKTIPTELQKYLDGDQSFEKKAKLECHIDPIYPKPLMTKTLARVSQLAKFDFEFSDESEQLATLNDLELLLLAEIADSELPETTRVSFAATLISRFSALVTPSKQPVSELTRLNREIHNLSLSEKKIAANWQQTDSKNLKVTLAQELATLRIDLKELRNSYKRINDQVRQIKRDRLNKSYALLLKAIHENPEKLRLWQRAIDFCLATGYQGLSKLQEELKRIGSTCKDTSNYIEALLLSDLAGKVAKALSLLQFEKLSKESQTQNLDFLIDVISTINKWSDSKGNPYYLERSKHLLSLTITAAEGALQIILKADNLKELTNHANNFYKNSSRIVYFNQDNDINYPLNSQFISRWLWWTESLSKHFNSIEPTALWLHEAPTLDPYEASSWKLWLKYPMQLPEVALDKILSGEKTFEKGYEGWLIDAFYELLMGPLGDQPQFPDELRSVIRSVQHKAGISLYEWNKWSNKSLTISPEFDPRFGEWTALEIIRQAIELLNSVEEHASKRNLPINPSNIVIPSEWMTLENIGFMTKNKILTWESWKGFVKEKSKISLSQNTNPINDYRLLPDYEDKYLIDFGWLRVRAMGLILLGLLRKDFCWPATWNIPDHAPVLDSSIRQLIGELGCSSFTTSILEACLLPRYRETSLLPFLQAEIDFESDTTNDAPAIESLRDLHQRILNSQRVLENYQYSVQAHKPKQLVPLRIEQLPRFGNDDLNLEEEPINE